MSWNLSTGLIKGLLGKDAPYGSVADLLTNGVIYIYSGTRPASSNDAVPAGSNLLCIMTLNGGAFVSGSPTNGINLGEFDGNTLKRAIDPATSQSEVWKGSGLMDGSAGWARWHSNSIVIGDSSTAVRMDGVISTSGGDMNMTNGVAIVTGVDSEVVDVAIDMGSV